MAVRKHERTDKVKDLLLSELKTVYNSTQKADNEKQ